MMKTILGLKEDPHEMVPSEIHNIFPLHNQGVTTLLTHVNTSHFWAVVFALVRLEFVIQPHAYMICNMNDQFCFLMNTLFLCFTLMEHF